MPALVDTSVLVRACDAGSSSQPECVALLAALQGRRHKPLVVCAQNVIEFYVVATRPLAVNGLGLSPADVNTRIDDLLRFVPCLPEPADVLDRWRQLVRALGVEGKSSHDARIVAVLRAHGLDEVVTYNTPHFARFPGVRCFTPAQALASGLLDQP